MADKLSTVAKDFIKDYPTKYQAAYEETCKTVEKQLKIGLKGIQFKSESRSKTKDSLEGTMIKREAENGKPFGSADEIIRAFHDLAGARITLYFPTDKSSVVTFIKNHFDEAKAISYIGINEKGEQKPKDVTQRFLGYHATHFRITMKKSMLTTDQLAAGLNAFTCEIQVMSIFMLAWHTVDHDLVYKDPPTGKVEDGVKDGLNIINGLMHASEMEMLQIRRWNTFGLANMLLNDQKRIHLWLLEYAKTTLKMREDYMEPEPVYEEMLYAAASRSGVLKGSDLEAVLKQGMPALVTGPKSVGDILLNLFNKNYETNKESANVQKTIVNDEPNIVDDWQDLDVEHGAKSRPVKQEITLSFSLPNGQETALSLSSSVYLETTLLFDPALFALPRLAAQKLQPELKDATGDKETRVKAFFLLNTLNAASRFAALAEVYDLIKANLPKVDPVMLIDVLRNSSTDVKGVVAKGPGTLSTPLFELLKDVDKHGKPTTLDAAKKAVAEYPWETFAKVVHLHQALFCAFALSCTGVVASPYPLEGQDAISYQMTFMSHLFVNNTKESFSKALDCVKSEKWNYAKWVW